MNLPAEEAEGPERLIPFGQWNRVVFVRSWRALGHGYFLIDFTHAKSGRSHSWRYAVVKEGFRREYTTNTQSRTKPTWVDCATVETGRKANDHGFNITVYPVGFEQMDWFYRKTATMWVTDREEACRIMLGFMEVLYGISFDGNAPRS